MYSQHGILEKSIQNFVKGKVVAFYVQRQSFRVYKMPNAIGERKFFENINEGNRILVISNFPWQTFNLLFSTLA